MGMKSKKNFKPYTPGGKNTKKMKKIGQTKKNLLLKKRLKTLLKPSTSNVSKIEPKTENSSKAVDSSLISSAINDKKFILHIESESDGYFKKQSTNIQTSNPSPAEGDKPKVNGMPPLDIHDTEMVKTKKKKSKKSKKRSKREEKASDMTEVLKEVERMEDQTENEITDELETSKAKADLKENKKLDRSTTQVNYIAIQKLPKSKKFKNRVSKQSIANDGGWSVGSNEKNSRKKTKSKEKNVSSHKNGVFEASQDECPEPERKKPCKKSKHTKTEKEKENKSTEKRHKKNKKEKKFISTPKGEACDVPVEEKEKFSDSDRSSYILQFFNDTAVDSRDEDMEESESIYEDESDYNDYMSESEIEEENEKSEDDGATDVKSSREKIEKSKKPRSDNKKGKSMKKKKVKTGNEDLRDSPEEESETKDGCLNMTTVADFLGEELVNDEEDEESVDDNECVNTGDDEEDEKSVGDNEGENFGADEEDEKSVADEEDEKSADDEEDENRVDDEKDDKSVEDEETEKSADDEEDEKSADDEEDEGSVDDEQDEKSANDEEDEKSADDEEDDRRLFNNWKNIEFFYDNFCSDDQNDHGSRNKKSSAKKPSMKIYKPRPEMEESEDSDFCLTDDYGSENSYETDEEEYDSFVEDEDSSFSLEYDDEEEASSFSEEEDEDGSYGYNFQEESDDEDYQLPEGEVEDVIVRPGKAKIYDMAGHNISFDSDSPQIIDLGNKPDQDDSEAWKSTALVRVTAHKSKDDEESDDSCPQLVPINYDLPSSSYYDYEFSEEDDDMIDSSYDFDSGSSDEAVFSETECQEENDAKQLSECKLLTTDGEKTVAYNLAGLTSLEQNTTSKEEEKVTKKTMKRTQEKSNVDRKPKKRKASDRFADEQAKAKDSKTNVEEMDSEKDEEDDNSKATNQDINVDGKIDNSQLNDMEVVEEAIFGDSQIGKEEIQNQPLKEGINSEELIIRKPQGWQNEVNLKTKSLFFNSFHSRYVLILLKDYLYFNGALKIKLLLGSAETFGYDLQRGKEVESYSIHGGAFLDLSPKTSENPVTLDEIEDQLSFYSQDFLSSDVSQIKKEFDKNRDALILLARNDNTKKIEMVRRYMRENLFPTMTGLDVASSSYTSQFILHTVFHNFDRNRCITFNRQWLDINLTANTKLAVIGGKSVGKSTLLRYTINRHLKKFKKILLIDLDIGQQEMFVPQTITATVVEKPILGPGYLFTNTPNKSLLFGHINVVISPLSYIRNVAELFKFCNEQNEFSDIPWVINTMGYTQGLGAELAAAVFNIAKPNLVVQIQSRKQKENFNCDMHTGNVRRIRSALLSEWLNDLHNLSYELKVFKSVSGGGFGRFRMNAKDSRFCMILARLGTILKEQHDWLTDVRPYSVSYDDISIITFSEHYVEDKESLLDIINANLVYLCKKEADSETTECYGIGVVRGVDKAQRKIFVIASLEVETLSLVNTLAVCNIPIPTSLLLNQGPKVKGSIPYTYNTENNAFTKHIYQYNSAHFFKAGRNNR